MVQRVLRSRIVASVGAVLALSLARSPAARAQGDAAQPPNRELEPQADPECYPACRSGFVCRRGQCISACNPPCGQGQVCVDGVRCDLATSSGIYEPPPPPPRANRGFGSEPHSALAFHLGMGGTTKAGSTEAQLDNTYGASVRSDFPVVEYLLLGPLIQVGAWRPDLSPTIARSVYADIDFYLRGRVPFDLESVDLQVWAGVPIGLSLSSLTVDLTQSVERFGVGWNCGVLAGAAIHFTEAFGLFAEGGFVWHDLSHHRLVGTGNQHRRIAQSNLNVGFMLEY
jgi:hypothetical protein